MSITSASPVNTRTAEWIDTQALIQEDSSATYLKIRQIIWRIFENGCLMKNLSKCPFRRPCSHGRGGRDICDKIAVFAEKYMAIC